MDWPLITGVSSTVIAFCALGLTIWQGMQARKHNRLSFRPHLTTWTHSNAEKGFYAIELINNGIGPAFIENFTVKVDNEPISGDGSEPIEKALKIVFSHLDYRSYQSYVEKGYSMAAKERCKLVEVQFCGQQFPPEKFVKDSISRGDIEISYKSLYEEVFYLSTKEEKFSQPLEPTR